MAIIENAGIIDRLRTQMQNQPGLDQNGLVDYVEMHNQILSKFLNLYKNDKMPSLEVESAVKADLQNVELMLESDKQSLEKEGYTNIKYFLRTPSLNVARRQLKWLLT